MSSVLSRVVIICELAGDPREDESRDGENDEEYTDAQIIVVNEEKSCPHCKEPEHKYYYYCEEHGSSEDDCKR